VGALCLNHFILFDLNTLLFSEKYCDMAAERPE
jgi:hypothetical protein